MVGARLVNRISAETRPLAVIFSRLAISSRLLTFPFSSSDSHLQARTKASRRAGAGCSFGGVRGCPSGVITRQKVIAHVFGPRTKKTLRKLIRLISGYKFKFYCTDNWKPYGAELSAQSHVVSKKLTQSIERTNLTLRTRLKRLARKTICFSRSEELHDKVIGEFISRMWYQPV